jgi:adenosylcobinamide-GDP ribazoletransferase
MDETPIDQASTGTPPAVSLLADLHLALAFLTRLPMPPLGPLPPGGLPHAMRLFPLVGLVVGALSGGVYVVAHWLLPTNLAAILAVATGILVTGGLHEDGLADIADGFGGGTDKETKLAIMKDSRVGSFGVLAVVIGLMLRTSALAALDAPGAVVGAVIAAHALGRGVIPAVLQVLRPARDSGLGAAAGKPSPATAGIAATLTLVLVAACLPAHQALAAVAGAALGAALVAWLAWRQIGGQTGDVLGAVEQAGETLALLAVLAAATA